MVTQPAQVTGLGQDGECVDRADAGDGLQPLVVGVPGQHGLGTGLDLVALADQASPLGQHHAEHRDCIGAGLDRQGDGLRRSVVNV